MCAYVTYDERWTDYWASGQTTTRTVRISAGGITSAATTTLPLAEVATAEEEEEEDAEESRRMTACRVTRR